MNAILQKLLENNFDLTKLDRTLDQLVDELIENPEIREEIEALDSLFGFMIKLKLYNKVFAANDFNSIKLCLEKVNKPVLSKAMEYAKVEIPIVGTEDFEEIEL